MRASSSFALALRDHLGFARNVVVQATCHGARQPCDGRRAVGQRRQGARRGHRQAQRHRQRVAGDARRRRARRALQLRQAAGRLHAQGRADGDRRAHCPTRLARGDLLRGGRPARAVGLLHRAAHDRGRGPHGPARRGPAGGRPAVRTVREVHARIPERVEQGQLPRAAERDRPEGAEWRAGRLPRRGAVCTAHRRDLPRPRVVGNRLARIRT